jgi:hypothetical protein
MRTVSHARRLRLMALAFVIGLTSIAGGATPIAAQTSTPFNAWFNEVTTFRPCPPGVPAGATCFTGHGDGEATPPGGDADEDYAGFVDNSQRDPQTGCAPDSNAVAITTSQGRLFLTTRGRGCPTGPPDPQGRVPVNDRGTWTAHGGTGIFRGATGSGTVETNGWISLNPDGSPRSAESHSVYTGQLFLR